MMTVLALLTLGLGLWPFPLIQLMEPSIQNLVEHIMQSKLG
jgi:NADH-quinone oxidoreductase subunit M